MQEWDASSDYENDKSCKVAPRHHGLATKISRQRDGRIFKGRNIYSTFHRYLDPWKWDDHNVTKGREPITCWRSTTSHKNKTSTANGVLLVLVPVQFDNYDRVYFPKH